MIECRLYQVKIDRVKRYLNNSIYYFAQEQLFSTKKLECQFITTTTTTSVLVVLLLLLPITSTTTITVNYKKSWLLVRLKIAIILM